MAKFLAIHTVDPKLFATDPNFGLQRRLIAAMTPEAQCITTWGAAGAGKAACEWEATSEQAIIDVLAKVPELPTDGIYPMVVTEWAELKKQLGM